MEQGVILNNIFSKTNIDKAIRLIKNGEFCLLFEKIEFTLLNAFFKRTNSNRTNLAYWIHENIQDDIIYDSRIFADEVDVIVPIYNGYEFLDRLFGTIARTDVPFKLLAVDDKSTDERIARFLNKTLKNFTNSILISNEENLGFVKSVNKALALAKNHVIIVNSDVELPDKWLERLITPLYMDDKIASATPFTNSGAICSFPVISEDNDLLPGLTLDETDKAFRTVKPAYYEVSSGVGFCMAMNINVIKKIGVFDDETFGKGYCEEADWCQRAIQAGYKNVIVENLFVRHKHGGSFSYDEKTELLKRNLKLFHEKYPSYQLSEIKALAKNPHHEQRAFLIMILLSKNTNIKKTCYFGLGFKSKSRNYTVSENNEIIYLIRYNQCRREYLLNIRWGKFLGTFKLETVEEIEYIIDCAGIQEISGDGRYLHNKNSVL